MQTLRTALNAAKAGQEAIRAEHKLLLQNETLQALLNYLGNAVKFTRKGSTLWFTARLIFAGRRLVGGGTDLASINFQLPTAF